MNEMNHNVNGHNEEPTTVIVIMNEMNHNDNGHNEERSTVISEIAKYNESSKRSRCDCSDYNSSTSSYIKKNIKYAPAVNETAIMESAVHDIEEKDTYTVDSSIIVRADEIIKSTLKESIDGKIHALITEPTDLEAILFAKVKDIFTEFKNLLLNNEESNHKLYTTILNRRLKAINEMVDVYKDSQAYELELRLKSTMKKIKQIHDKSNKSVTEKLIRMEHKMEKMYDLLALSVSIMSSVDRQVNESKDIELKEAVEFIIGIEGNKNEVGASITKCARLLGYLYGENVIREAVEELDSEGIIYATTATKEYYKLTQPEINGEDGNPTCQFTL